MRLYHLADCRLVRPNHVVRQEHRERLIAHRVPRGQDGVSQAALLRLRHAGYPRHLADAPNRRQRREVAPRFQRALQLRRPLEIARNGVLPLRRHKNHFLDSRPRRLVHAVVDGRRIEHRQGVLRNRQRRRQKPSPKPGDGDDRFLDSHKANLPNGLMAGVDRRNDFRFIIEACQPKNPQKIPPLTTYPPETKRESQSADSSYALTV